MANTKKIPTQLKILKGTAQPCRLNKKEPEPALSNDIKMPSKMPPVARKKWKEVTKQLIDIRILSDSDLNIVELFCREYSVYIDAIEHITAQGSVLTDDETGKMAKNPYVTIRQKAFDQMKYALVELGMTPSARTKVQTIGNKESSNPFQRFK